MMLNDDGRGVARPLAVISAWFTYVTPAPGASTVASNVSVVNPPGS